jgi:hypothetical protein
VRKKTLKSWAAGSGRRDVMKRAAADLARGRRNTDCRLSDRTSQEDCPQPARGKRSGR